MAFVNMNNLNSLKNTVYIHGTNDKISSAYLGAIDNTPRYNDSTFDYRVYLTKSLGQTTSLDESLFSLDFLYKNKIDVILTDTFKLDVLYDNNRSIEDIYLDLERVYANNAIGIFDLSTCFYTTSLTKEIPLFATIEQETLEDYYKDNKFFESVETDEDLFKEFISKVDNVDLLSNVDNFYDYVKKNYLKYYKLTKQINDIYFKIIKNMAIDFEAHTNNSFSFYDFTTTFGITSDKYRASKIVGLYNHIVNMQKIISYALSNHKYIEEGLKFFDDIDKKFPIEYKKEGVYNKNEISWDKCDTNELTDVLFTDYVTIGSRIVAGTDENGIMYSDDNGKTWIQSDMALGTIAHMIVKDSAIVASVDKDGIWYSEDNGKTWVQTNADTNGFYVFGSIGDTIVAGSGMTSNKGILYSEDNGHTWNQSDIIEGGFNDFVVLGSIIVAGSYGINGKGLFYSEDNGKTWTQSDNTTSKILCLITIDSTIIAGTSKGFCYSEDNGKTWTKNDSNFVVNTLFVSDSRVIAGTERGIMYSDDNGKTWNPTDVIMCDVRSLNKIGNTLLAGLTFNSRGLLYSEDNGKNWDQFYEFSARRIVSISTISDTILVSSLDNGKSFVEYSKPVDKKLIFNIPKMPNLYNVLWSIVDTRLSKISSIKENTEMFNYFSCELIHNNITYKLKDLMTLGIDLVNPLLESSKTGKLCDNENNIDKVYSILTENYSKIKLLIRSLLINETDFKTLTDNNEFIIYLYISVMILMTLAVISSSSTKNKVFQTVDFDTIMQVLGIDYQKTYSETDILNFISNYQ